MSTKYLCKVTWFAGQCRITIPKNLVEKSKLEDAEYLILEKPKKGLITLRRFVDAKGNKRSSNAG